MASDRVTPAAVGRGEREALRPIDDFEITAGEAVMGCFTLREYAGTLTAPQLVAMADQLNDLIQSLRVKAKVLAALPPDAGGEDGERLRERAQRRMVEVANLFREWERNHIVPVIGTTDHQLYAFTHEFSTLAAAFDQPAARRSATERKGGGRGEVSAMTGYLAHRPMREEWGTPASIFDPLHAEFGFTLDAAALPHNAKCARYFTPDTDGLAQSWAGEVVWLNPPYGHRNLAQWMAKAYHERERATVVCLVPAHTGQPWWHAWVAGKAEIRWIRGKVCFLRPDGTRGSAAPFPSCIVIYRRNDHA